MQRKFYLFTIISSILLVFFIFSSTLFAKTITLYDQPKDDGKVIGTLDLSAGIIPIFTPKEGVWMKVGDPRNGQVGWIKSSDIGKDAGTITFTQRIIDEGKGPHTYQVIEYGKPQNLTSEQVQNLVQKMQTQQQDVQQATQKAVQTMINDMQTIYQNATKGMGPSPVIMPIVIIPQQKPTSAPTAPVATPAPAPAKTQ